MKIVASKKTRYNKSNILFHNIMRVLCSTCTPSIFQFFDLKYILPKTSSRGFSWLCSIYAYIFVSITYLRCLNLVVCMNI